MRTFLYSFFIVVLMGMSAVAQEQPRVQIFGGYSYMNTPQDFSLANRMYLADSTYRGTASGGTNQNGWNTSLSESLTRNLAMVADISGHYQSDGRDIQLILGRVDRLNLLKTRASSATYSFLFGPRISFLPGKKINPFGHVLLGFSKTNQKETGTLSVYPDAAIPFNDNLSDSSFAFTVGGGMDWKCSKRISIRLLQADYMRVKQNFQYDRSITTGDPWTNDKIANRLRISTGIVFNIGKT
jgi:hypothetical protein